MDVRFQAATGTGIVIAFAGKTGDDVTLSSPAAALDRACKKRISQSIAAARFKGDAGATLVIPAPGGGYDLAVIAGLGDLAKADGLAIEKASASAVKAVLTSGSETASVLLSGWRKLGTAETAARAAFGACLAAYRFDGYRTKLKESQKPSLKSLIVDVAGSEAAWVAHSAVVDGVYVARDLVNEPSNVLHPEAYAARVEGLASLGLKVKVLGEAEMAELGMHSMLGVGLGSQYESKLAIMEWHGGGDEAPLALVGKGVCFDTGGISIKPSGGMEDMKGDMGGSAAVVGAMVALATRNAKANVVGLIGLVENMPDGKAQRPGDIVTSMSGQTIEVLNTDAEGRLVLCDVMTYAQRFYKPSNMIDLATLTGAIIISLGSEYAGLFSNSDDLSARITKAGISSDEPVWRLPQSPAYNKLLDSKIADMKNVQRSGGGAGAGSITAAQFLGRFVEDGVNWAHIDIAGTAWKGDTGDAREPSWASGYGVRLLNRLVADSFES
jgi:leucyl aminopeptidase